MAIPCCGGSSDERLVFTCAGAAYAGQLANRVGVGLMQSGQAKLFCAAAMAAGIGDKLARAQQARQRIVIDGCEDHCARKILESARVPVDLHVEITAMGIEKQPEQPHFLVDTKRVLERIEAQLHATT